MSEGAPWIFGDARPNQPAAIVADTGAELSFGDLNNRSARLANCFVAQGLVAGDAIALLLENGTDFFVALWAARRAGLLCVPLNWHLAPPEISWILDDCHARAVIASRRFTGLVDTAARPGLLRYADADVVGWQCLDMVIGQASATRPEIEIGGGMMLYSSGTTGRPKGIIASGGQGKSLDQLTTYEELYRDFHEVDAASIVLTAGPLYHAAPLNWAIGSQRLGATVYIFRQFDAALCLDVLEAHSVSHVQMVPIHFVRLLKLPKAVRQAARPAALKRVVHAGAPCPVVVKAQMLEWWGPFIWEYYSGSEGFGMTAISPQEWLAHPGSVGRPHYGGEIAIVGPDQQVLPSGDIGTIYFTEPKPFDYRGQEQAAREAYHEKGWATFGDMGWLDAEGYLYLADRRDNMIISGGVNIYPAEIEAVLIEHPDVTDVAVIGIPDKEYGEQVHAVIEAKRGASEAFEQELCRMTNERLARFKTPRSFEFAAALPRSEAGKLVKRELRDLYWGDARVRI